MADCTFKANNHVALLDIPDDKLWLKEATLFLSRNSQKLPKSNTYEPEATPEQIVAMLDDIGYDWPKNEIGEVVKTIAKAEKNPMSAVWNYFFTPFIQCMGEKTRGLDQASSVALKKFPLVVSTIVEATSLTVEKRVLALKRSLSLLSDDETKPKVDSLQSPQHTEATPFKGNVDILSIIFLIML
ncbi:hypothetical protein L6452_03027 [Arctium lappa]|uniref:Uncharacterized protein n=1 Tax=Arctium lappa TaxID=4217 RepID=A0ACB9FM11_ARCLA|nr:hypothetical protein L6452_03027 [Arctium lappa]